ncbi:MAG: hypothetical protein E4H05_07580 [Acidimicrobiales bacterium]|nr:MAG: hypothetical protein E4H05_07580 [Acidimicrobiales bacterium]
MGGAIGGSVGYALGIAISPIPIAALILTLLSVNPRRASLAFTLGVFLVLAAIRRWRARPDPQDEPPTPPLMRAIDRTGAFGILGIGFALAASNPKDTLDERLHRSRELLIRHDAAVMAIVLVGVGVLFITEAIQILRG